MLDFIKKNAYAMYLGGALTSIEKALDTKGKRVYYNGVLIKDGQDGNS